MLARDIMTTSVVTSGLDTPVSEIAKTLLDNRISGVPIVDENGKLVGIVSEGDLMRRPDLGTEHHRSWWLALFGNADRTAEYIKSHGQKARDVMTSDVMTVDTDTAVGDIASVLEKNRIKRVPVLKDGELVGLVSRANLLHALTSRDRGKTVSGGDASIRSALMSAMKEAGLQTHLINLVVADGVVHVYGILRSETEKIAVRVAADNVDGINGLEDETSVLPETVVANI